MTVTGTKAITRFWAKCKAAFASIAHYHTSLGDSDNTVLSVDILNESINEGFDNKTIGKYTHTQNYGTVAFSKAQTTLGTFNQEDSIILSETVLGSEFISLMNSHSSCSVSKSILDVISVKLNNESYLDKLEWFPNNQTIVFINLNKENINDNDVFVITYKTHPNETAHSSGDKLFGSYAVIIGNGVSDSNRSNALAVRWDGFVDVGDEHTLPTFYYTTSNIPSDGDTPLTPCKVIDISTGDEYLYT